ncbi:MAG: endonuclease/exonuclease/phosphatase family protein [Bacteroidota bacterium]
MKGTFYSRFLLVSFITLIILLINNSQAYSQDEKQYKAGVIAFYNLENLFDTIDAENVIDEEYLPGSKKNWDTEKYNKKLDKLAEVISQIGNDLTKEPPAVLGISEVENIQVVKDLVNTGKLKPYNYQVVHYDSPDRRGVDVALVYRPAYFKLTGSRSVRLTIAGMPDFYTRDQLVVSGEYDGEPMHFIVNHWPSRRGGEKRSRPLRNAAGDLTRSIADSILATDANAKVIIMGDLNDDPVNPSLKDHLKATDDESLLTQGYLYNAMMPLYKKGIGSLAYRDSWNLFDQMVLTPALVGEDKPGYRMHSARVFNKKFLEQKEGRFKGYPFRTFVGNNYMGGYSDHFPVYVILVREL